MADSRSLGVVVEVSFESYRNVIHMTFRIYVCRCSYAVVLRTPV